MCETKTSENTQDRVFTLKRHRSCAEGVGLMSGRLKVQAEKVTPCQKATRGGSWLFSVYHPQIILAAGLKVMILSREIRHTETSFYGFVR